MKNKFYANLLKIFIGGVIIFGVGVGVCFEEFTSFEVVNQPIDLKSETISYNLPQSGEVIYLMGDTYNDFIEIISDDTVPKGKFNIDMEYCGDHISKTEINNNYILKDVDIQTGETKVYQVKCLDMPYVINRSNSDDFQQMSDFLKNLKDKKFVNRVYQPTKTTIHVNPEDRNRLVAIWLHNDINIVTKSDYINELEERNAEMTYADQYSAAEYDEGDIEELIIEADDDNVIRPSDENLVHYGDD